MAVERSRHKGGVLQRAADALRDLNAQCADLWECLRRVTDAADALHDSERRTFPIRRHWPNDPLARAVAMVRRFDLEQRLWEDSVALLRAVRVARHAVEPHLEPFIRARADAGQFNHPRFTGETGARAIWNFATRLSGGIREVLRDRMRLRRKTANPPPVGNDPLEFLLNELLTTFNGIEARDFADLAAALRWERALTDESVTAASPRAGGSASQTVARTGEWKSIAEWAAELRRNDDSSTFGKKLRDRLYRYKISNPTSTDFRDLRHDEDTPIVPSTPSLLWRRSLVERMVENIRDDERRENVRVAKERHSPRR